METENIEITISRQQAHELWDILERIRNDYVRMVSLYSEEKIYTTIDGQFCVYRSEAAAIDDILPQLRNALNE